MSRERVLAVARGEAEADLVLANARVVNVFTGEILDQSVAVADGVIAAVGEARPAREQIDLAGRFLCPGLIDAHVHIESSMVAPAEFARAVVPRGTTTVVSDPHEIANVCGLEGVLWMLAASEGLPLDVLVNAPSCVPASHLATAGATLDADAVASLKAHPRVLGLAEVMNVPGVVLGDAEVHRKIAAFAGRPVDGHAPGVAGPWLDAYCAAGVESDHECVTAEEALSKLRHGLWLFLREGTAARNLLALLPVVTARTASRCALCSDDRHPHDLLDAGHLDHMIRLCTENGVDPVTAIQMATINPAQRFGLNDRGAIVPGRRADMIVASDLASFRADCVFSRGRRVADSGRCVDDRPPARADDRAVRVGLRVTVDQIDLGIPAQPGPVRVIGIVPGQIVTEHLRLELPQRDGRTVADPRHDVAKLAVVERHHGSGRVGLGFVRGLGLRCGAVASTVAHDHHNLVVAGADDESMRAAIAAVVAMGGGLVAAHGDRVLHELPLPLGGLMSDRSVENVRCDLDRLCAAARELGCSAADPWMVLSFLGLEVIPALRLTDLGLVDVERFELVPLSAA